MASTTAPPATMSHFNQGGLPLFTGNIGGGMTSFSADGMIPSSIESADAGSGLVIVIPLRTARMSARKSRAD